MHCRFADTDLLLQKYLEYIVSSDGFQNHLKLNFRGSTNLFVNWSDAAKYQFSLPSVDEQRRIADLLWAADDMMIRDGELIESLIVHKKSLFENLIEKELANGAKLVKLGELMLRSPDSGHSPISVDRETGHYVLILSAVSVNGYRRGHLKPVELIPEVKGTILQKGDFLISRSNTVELVGLVGIYDEDRNDISFPDTMMRLILDDSKIDRYFLEQYLLSRKARRKIQGFAAGTSGSMKKINRSHISALEIPLLPLEQQHSIMKMIQKCADGISAAEDRRNKSYELKKQLLNKMLSS
jgi:restriction endonuclease S subunit